MTHPFIARIARARLGTPHGAIRRILPGRLEATGPELPLGALCEVGTDGAPLLAEVAAVDEDGLILVPLESAEGLRPSARVLPHSGGAGRAGDCFAGRAVDALGRAIDGKSFDVDDGESKGLGGLPAALDRIAPSLPLITGVRAIDGLLTLAQGQRIGIFAASGVGKTSLIEQMTQQIQADRCVLCLVGERGREVESIWRDVSRRKDANRFTLVAATSDETAAMRARSVDTALRLAEHWRSHGEHVLLVLDSVTRYAMALREIGLAAGEPPTVRAYTPNVFAALPRLVERCGAVRGGGAITAVLTVLSETDDVDDPIVEVMKSLLDGHIVLSRTLAERGQFPAIDVPRSISRLADRVMAPAHAAAARSAVSALASYDEARVMIESGVYKPGASAEIDQAIAVRTRLLEYLAQRRDERSEFAASVAGLQTAVGTGPANG